MEPCIALIDVISSGSCLSAAAEEGMPALGKFEPCDGVKLEVLGGNELDVMLRFVSIRQL